MFLRRALACIALSLPPVAAGDGAVRLDLRVVADDLRQPTALVFMSPRQALLAERANARLSVLDPESGRRTRVADGLEAVVLTGEDAGLHDVALHPDFMSNGWIYASYSSGTEERSTLAVDRFHLRDERLTDRVRIFTAKAHAEERFHYGGRMAFLHGYLYVTIGDRHQQHRAQELTTHMGKIVRLHDDGRVPADNPFVGRDGALPEIWSYGHRNPQGLAVHPRTGELWSHEHGPLGGDELNLVRRGANYGWPVISYGWEYAGGPIGMGITRREGMEQPHWVWTPAIAPSGLVIHSGEGFAGWRDSFLVGAMGRQHLNRLAMEEGRVVLEERLLTGKAGRVRLVAQSPEGSVYLGNDNGQLLRMAPSR